MHDIVLRAESAVKPQSVNLWISGLLVIELLA